MKWMLKFTSIPTLLRSKDMDTSSVLTQTHGVRQGNVLIPTYKDMAIYTHFLKYISNSNKDTY